MSLEIVNTGTKPNNGTGDTFILAWKKVNNNFGKLSKVFNLKLDKVKETDSLEDIRPNMIIVNKNFELIERRLSVSD